MEETPILSVTEVSQALKGLVETAFARIKVKGEVSAVKRAASGHIYFSVKDADSVLNAICWRGYTKSTEEALVEGMEVVCTGHLSTYPGRSNYQMIVQAAEPVGIGALLKRLEELKKKLAAEGLFDASRKKPIPYLPETIGVVTSPTGAVIRDIMHRITDRFGRQVYLWPVLVQGEGAAAQIAAAINGFNAIPESGIETPDGLIRRPDVLIVARGGGSLEDLWCFNDESVVRAAAAGTIPMISAVGHETDTTLIDYVSDLRAPTPTGAAEKAVPVRAELMTQMTQIQGRLMDSLYRLAAEKKLKLDVLARGLPNLSDLVNQYGQRLDDKSERLTLAFDALFCRLNDRFEQTARLLEANSYERVLDKGFAFVTDAQHMPVTSVQKAKTHPTLTIHFKDGSLPVTTRPKGTSKPHPPVPEQGSLF